MIQTLLGFKTGQSQTFTDDGRRIPVTSIIAGPCWVTRVWDAGSYQKVQLGFGNVKNISRAVAGHIKKAGLDIKPRFLREIRLLKPDENIKVGMKINVADVFQTGDSIQVTGTSKGKGFAGVVKRHHFKGGPRTHGQSDRERAPGSIGQTTTPGRVYRGKRMAGHMGDQRVTVKGLKVVAIDSEKNILSVKGLVPGGARSLLLVAKAS